ncbi:MAG: hypothetical protein KME45_19695 [Stenomitos rutilans HA7619-LM2]|jgi:hypothetical protein|nr:hypothetical protein [Stenomitos rutilans HA7619-LM2]
MPFPKGQNPNHPIAGSTIKVEPIRDKKAMGLSRHKGKKVPDGLEALSRLSLSKAVIR